MCRKRASLGLRGICHRRPCRDSRLEEESNAMRDACRATWNTFALNSLIFQHVIKRVVHEATIAALVAFVSRAVNELLLGQVGQLATLLEVGALERGDGGEGPA